MKSFGGTAYFSATGVTMYFNRLASILLFLGLTATATAQSLIAYYSFDDGTANDASGHGFDATFVSATYNASAGHSGGAFQFNGAGNYIQIDSLNINPGARPQLTMGAWVRATDVSPIRQIISHDDGSFDRSLGLDYRGSLTGWSTFIGGGVLAGETATVGNWTFVAVAYDAGANTARLYVDGHSYTATTGFGTGWTFTRIGSNPTFGEFFSGTIDDVFFFDRALSTAELDQVRLNGVTAIPEPPAATSVMGLTMSLAFIVRLTRSPKRASGQPSLGSCSGIG